MNTAKNIDLSFIESELDEEIYMLAEEIIDNRLVLHLTEKKKNKWDALVSDQGMRHTVQVWVVANKVKSYQCTCPSSNGESICAHIGATLIELRKTLLDAQIREQNQVSSRSRSRTLDTRSLMSHISKDELVDFIQGKARKDRNFKLLFQASFIKKISRKDLNSFVESTFPVLTKANEKIAASKLKAYVDITEELIKHVKNLLSEGNLIEAHELIYLLLKKSFYVKHHLSTEKSRFIKMHKELLKDFAGLYDLIEAPEYRAAIVDQVDLLLETSYISAELPEEQEIWIKQIIFHDEPEKLALLAKSYLSRGKQEYNSYYFIKTVLLLLTEEKEERLKAIEYMDGQEKYRIIQYVVRQKHLPIVHQVLFDFYLYSELSHPLAKAIIEHIVVPKEQQSDFISRTIDYYTRFNESAYLEGLDNLGLDRGVYLDIILSSLEERAEISAIIKMHLYYENFDACISLLSEHLSWSLLTDFDEKLLEVRPKQLYDLYYQMIKNYVDDHFGEFAREFSNRAFVRLNNLGHREMITRLKVALKAVYPDRKSLWS